MEPYSPVEKQITDSEIGDKPAPYNLLIMLGIFLIYLLCAFLV